MDYPHLFCLVELVDGKKMRNRVQCLLCGEVIESKFRHDYVTCKCGNVSVDGGKDYCKVNFKTNKWKIYNDEDEIKCSINGIKNERIIL